MEYLITLENEEFYLPVPPPKIEIVTGLNNTVLNILDIGEINVIGRKKLEELTIESFFPKQNYSFVKTLDLLTDPYEYVKKFEEIRDSKKPFELTISDINTNFKKHMSIEAFNYREEDGTGDVYYSLKLKEYRIISVKSETDTQSDTSLSTRPSKTVSEKYVVKEGDTLWGISKKKYGDGSKYQIIADKNNIKDVNKIYTGQVLEL